MEYVITANRPFEETEALLTDALKQQGLLVQRTFSLRSAAGSVGESGSDLQGSANSPGYSVLMLYAAGTPSRPLGLLTLYERGRRTVINPVLTPTENGRLTRPTGDWGSVSAEPKSEFVAALGLGGLDLCMEVARGKECIDPGDLDKEGATSGYMVQDPVCGKWIDLREAEAGIEHEGIIYHVCCSLCQEEFEREPARYARAR